MAALQPQPIGLAGLTPTFTAATTDTTPPLERGFFVMRNTHATNTSTFTITVPGSLYGVARPDPALVLPALTQLFLWAPLAGDLADPNTGLITVVTTGTGTPGIAVCTL